MEINHSAPAIAAGETFIEAAPEVVFRVIAAIDAWPSWNTDVTSVEVDGDVVPGTTFRWKAGPVSLVSKLEVVDLPREIGWTGTTMSIRALHVFRFEARDSARSPGPRNPGRGWSPPSSRDTAAGRWKGASRPSSRL